MKNILEFLEKTTESFPNKIGFTDIKREATFLEVTNNAKKIATTIKETGENTPVAIMIDKNVNLIESMFGVLYSGSFYVVIDVHSPIDRIKNIFEVLSPVAVITDEESKELANEIKTSEELFVYEDAIKADVDDEFISSVRAKMIDTDPIYALFTSGSTGAPKGAVLSHKSVISYINWVSNEFAFDENTSFGSQTPLYFSMSVTDLYSTVKCGSTFNIIPKSYFSFPMNLINYLNEKKINTIYWVPSAISILSNWKAFDYAKPEFLKTVLFAGEVMPTKQLNYWINNLPDCKYANLFGPTETTDICTFYVVNRKFEDDESLPIGNACNNCDVFIVNDKNERAKDGEEGELFARGSFLASGYYNNPEKTKEAFVQNPLNNSYPETVYKTGDLVKLNEMGEIIYLTRKDFQIKRMGYRIELGEIEAAVNSLEKIKACAAVYDQNDDCLFVVYEGGYKDTSVVLDAIRKKVPQYMHPDKVLRVKQMPHNANGKIDRKALKAEYKNY